MECRHLIKGTRPCTAHAVRSLRSRMGQHESPAKISFWSLWSPASSAATQPRARSQFPYHASAPGGGITRRCGQGAAATRARNLPETRSGGARQTRSSDQARHPLRHHEQFFRARPSTSRHEPFFTSQHRKHCFAPIANSRLRDTV